MIWGWDVSTSIIGIAVFSEESCKPVSFHKIDLRKIESMQLKYIKTANEITSLIAQYDGEHRHFIEDRLGGFTRGFTNQNTLLKLAMMNAVVTFIIGQQKSSLSIRHLAPVSVKKIVGLKVAKGQDKKLAAINFAKNYDKFPLEMKKGNKTPKDGVADIADALLLAVAGYKLLYESR